MAIGSEIPAEPRGGRFAALRGAAAARTGIAVGVSAVALVVAMTAAVAIGPVSIPAGTVWKVVGWHVAAWGDPYSWTDVEDSIVWDLRAPRVLLAALVGASLSIVGVAMQALVRNPLADPFLLGISSGAGAGAVLVIVSGASLGIASVTGGAFVGAFATFALVYAFARRGGTMTPLRLVLAGVAISYAMFGITSMLVARASAEEAKSATFWLSGSLAGARWDDLGLPTAALVVCLVVLVGLARPLNALLLGDETAASLGIGVDRLRRILFILSSAVVAAMVALTGGIGFVGLVVPHAVRMVVGTDHRRVLPVAAFAGASFLVAVDLVARTAAAPGELPVGVVTSLVGAPVFLWLMSRGGRGEVRA